MGPVAIEDLDAARAASRERADAERRNGPKSVDLADIIDVIIATGKQIGEVLALHWPDIELTAPPARRDDATWFPWLMGQRPDHLQGQAGRLRQDRRRDPPITLPDWAVAILRRRRLEQPPNDIDASSPAATEPGTSPATSRAGCGTSASLTSTPTSPRSAISRPTPSGGLWRPRSTRPTTPKPPRIRSATRPRRSPSGSPSTAGSWCRTTGNATERLAPRTEPTVDPEIGLREPSNPRNGPREALCTTRRPAGRFLAFSGGSRPGSGSDLKMKLRLG